MGSETRKILQAYRGDKGCVPIALATIVKVEGSSYRHPGARMLICADGRRFGTVSAGCLEADVAEHARHVFETGEPRYVVYDASGPNGDLVIESGCHGLVGILIEPMRTAADTLDFLEYCANRRVPSAAATVFRGTTHLPSGSHIVLCSATAFEEPADDLLSSLRNETVLCFKQSSGRNITLDAETGPVEALIEFIAPPTALVICGAGRDAAPMVRMANFLGWNASVADRRHRFPGARIFEDAELIACDSELLPDRVVIDEYTAVVVMTHSYAHDLALLRQLMPSRAGYVGLLGSRRRADRLCADLRDEGAPITAGDWKRLHAPAGLDIGSETPEEIALSVVSEIQAVLHGRVGGHLRGSAHGS